LNDYRGFESLN